ncbi:methionine synthase I (cobalamin-dependent) [Mycobacterium sp. AZCC_0083]|nr:hypothetical protein [Mycobacterium sp. AZCC_0083]MBB5161465.1 methionine synthase I (cobalamin-dependent) [Mycobacterium sp. AZCC_0083]
MAHASVISTRVGFRGHLVVGDGAMGTQLHDADLTLDDNRR